MIDSLEILNGSGHLTLTWNPSDPAEVVKAQEEVARLKAAGYSFFAVVDSDPIRLGNGKLSVERIDNPVMPPIPEPVISEESKVLPPEPGEIPKKKPGGRRNVAVRAMAGG